MKTLELTNGGCVKVNDEDYNNVKDYSWYKIKIGNTCYARRTNDKIYMHRLLLNTPSNLETDHVDGNGLNNCRNNLRVVNKMQNQMNGDVRKNNTSGYPGVGWHKRTSTWWARIRSNGKNIFLGHFIEKDKAIEARKQAEIKYFGEFRAVFPA